MKVKNFQTYFQAITLSLAQSYRAFILSQAAECYSNLSRDSILAENLLSSQLFSQTNAQQPLETL